jgi:hypothetical protein
MRRFWRCRCRSAQRCKDPDHRTFPLLWWRGNGGVDDQNEPIIHYYGYRRYLEHAGYEIPYRCILPQEVAQLMVVGRCMSSDQPAYESWRSQAPVTCIGQAAGTAAALCRKRIKVKVAH